MTKYIIILLFLTGMLIYEIKKILDLLYRYKKNNRVKKRGGVDNASNEEDGKNHVRCEEMRDGYIFDFKEITRRLKKSYLKNSSKTYKLKNNYKICKLNSSKIKVDNAVLFRLKSCVKNKNQNRNNFYINNEMYVCGDNFHIRLLNKSGCYYVGDLKIISIYDGGVFGDMYKLKIIKRKIGDEKKPSDFSKCSNNMIYFIARHKLNYNVPNLILKKNSKSSQLIYENNFIVTNYNTKNKSSFSMFDKSHNDIITEKIGLYISTSKQIDFSYNIKYILKKHSTIQYSENNLLKSSFYKLSSVNYYNFFNDYIIVADNKKITMLLTQLPHKIINSYKKTNKNISLYEYVFSKDVAGLEKYDTNKLLAWLYKKRKYCVLYKYILINIVGVSIIGDTIRFYKSNGYLKNAEIIYKGSSIKKYNNNAGFYFIYRNIIYNNVPVIKLGDEVITDNKHF